MVDARASISMTAGTDFEIEGTIDLSGRVGGQKACEQSVAIEKYTLFFSWRLVRDKKVSVPALSWYIPYPLQFRGF